MVRKGWNGQELKLQSQPDHGVMDRAAANLIHTRTQMGRTTNVGDVEFFLKHMDRRVGENHRISKLQPRHCTMHKTCWSGSEPGFERTVLHVLSGPQRTPRSTCVALRWPAPKW
jgi:hypothetical protein